MDERTLQVLIATVDFEPLAALNDEKRAGFLAEAIQTNERHRAGN